MNKEGWTKRMRAWGKGISFPLCYLFTRIYHHREDVVKQQQSFLNPACIVYSLFYITTVENLSVVAPNHIVSLVIQTQSSLVLKSRIVCLFVNLTRTHSVSNASSKHSERCWTLAMPPSVTARVVFMSGLFVSVSVGCLMQLGFCDGWLQCFSNQEWGPGPFPLGVHVGRALGYLSNPAVPWPAFRELNP